MCSQTMMSSAETRRGFKVTKVFSVAARNSAPGLVGEGRPRTRGPSLTRGRRMDAVGTKHKRAFRPGAGASMFVSHGMFINQGAGGTKHIFVKATTTRLCLPFTRVCCVLSVLQWIHNVRFRMKVSTPNLTANILQAFGIIEMLHVYQNVRIISQVSCPHPTSSNPTLDPVSSIHHF